jgi:RNA polymerase sigma-70 factor (ECF subfamily)
MKDISFNFGLATSHLGKWFYAQSASAMMIQNEIRIGLTQNLAHLWRYGLALSKSRETAEDLVQATCLRAIERSHQFHAETNLRSWLFTILRSIWLNEVRSRRVRVGAGILDPEDVLFSDGLEIETNLFTGQVLNAVHGLPETMRETVLLVYVEGMTYSEAAAILGIPRGTVMSRLAAARTVLSRFSNAPLVAPTKVSAG